MINRFKNIVIRCQPNCEWEKRWNSSSYSLQIICSDFIIVMVLKNAICIARKNVVDIFKNEDTNLECNLVKLKGWTTPVLLCSKVCGKRDLKVRGRRNIWYFLFSNKHLGVLGWWIICWIGPKPASRLWSPVQENPGLQNVRLFLAKVMQTASVFPSTAVPHHISSVVDTKICGSLLNNKLKDK